MPTLVDTLSGAIGAGCCTAFGLPFDVAKARLQNSPHAYGGLIDCTTKTARHEGFLALYRGWLPALSSAVAENSVGITTQRTLRRRLAAWRGVSADTRYSVGVEVGLGAATGVFTSVAITPFEVLKVRLQVQTHGASSGGTLATVAGGLLRNEGARGLFRGLPAVICRDVPFNALFYGAYETICTLCLQWKGLSNKDELSSAYIFVAGGLAGCIGWSCILPFDVVKTRQQAGSATGSVTAVMRQVVATGGWRALFHGWTAAVCRAFPANAGLFLGVEVSSRWLARLLDENSEKELR